MNVTDAELDWLDYLTMLLVIVGALNWGLVGLGGFAGGDWNLVALVLGAVPSVENLVYLLVGLAGINAIRMVKQLIDAA